jgi:hypothetical protein
MDISIIDRARELRLQVIITSKTQVAKRTDIAPIFKQPLRL